MPRGPGKKSNYNLDYSRFNTVGREPAEEAGEEVVASSDIPPLQEMVRGMPVELQEAYHLLSVGRANGDATAERRANELVLQAIQKASPEVQRDFVQQLAKHAPESASALADAMNGALTPAVRKETQPGLAELGNSIESLRMQMESGAEAARKQMENLQRQQEQLEQLRSPEDFLRFMHQEGSVTEEDLQRIFGGDEQHMERCLKGMLDRAATGGTDRTWEEPEKALKAAEQVHAALCGSAASPEAVDSPAPAAAVAPTLPVRVAKPPEEEVRIPDHRLQYQKDADGRYVGVELRCTLPGVSDMSAIALDVSEKHVRLTTCAPAPRYAVNAGPFPVLIEPSAARAKYSKRKTELSISVPSKAEN
mmetsp:Transcript_41477/g.115268  ORF Transcript_41477/g.115268 Transcript_41477/m.115268 type:complete len:364 (-) Transcript_41477:115-1206(-)|eukprot:CAMPEP_0179098952 /NCGR_PEP_ID=MMETSP0796-20121207/45626_1 /TAXON_ID=73915 /ORGANISM="Pyrodinium bahamense, Strain pbaha01" /LENGTH=363 /DNA_ID=CAMNT_0020796741 /DNA_START=107 /DNA_END=1198 /DNA_ORIENTATION=+